MRGRDEEAEGDLQDRLAHLGARGEHAAGEILSHAAVEGADLRDARQPEGEIAVARRRVVTAAGAHGQLVQERVAGPPHQRGPLACRLVVGREARQPVGDDHQVGDRNQRQPVAQRLGGLAGPEVAQVGPHDAERDDLRRPDGGAHVERQAAVVAVERVGVQELEVFERRADRHVRPERKRQRQPPLVSVAGEAVAGIGGVVGVVKAARQVERRRAVDDRGV